MRSLEPSENQIEMAIGHFLLFESRNYRKHPFAFYKQNVRGFFKDGRFCKDRNPFAWTGLSDYVIVYRGLHLCQEVKKPKEKQTKNQIDFECYIKSKGGADYDVVRSVEESKISLDRFVKKVDKICLVLNKEDSFASSSVDGDLVP